MEKVKETNSILAIGLGLISLFVLMGWVFDIPEFVQIHKSLVPMQFNTALGFLLLSVAFLLKENNYRLFSNLVALQCLILGGISGLQYLVGVSFGIDELFMTAHITTKTTFPGRMSSLTAFSFVVSSLAILNSHFEYKRKIKSIVSFGFYSILFFLSVTALVRYCLGASGIYAWQVYTQMALHTSFCFFLVTLYLVNLKTQFLRKTEKKQFYISSFISFIFFLVFVVFSTEINKYEYKTIKTFFDEESRAINQRIIVALDSRVNAFARMADRAYHSPYLSEEKFAQDAKLYIKHFSELQAIEQLNTKNQIVWYSPLEGNEILKEKVLNKESSRSKTIEQAQKMNASLFSPIVDLYQGGKGIILFTPIASVEGQNDGFIVSVFKFERFVKNLFGSDLEKYSIDISQQEEIFYSNTQDIRSIIQPKNVAIQRHGLDWNFKISPKNAYIRSLKSFYAELILVLGTLVSLFLGNITSLYQKINRKNKEIEKTSKIKSDFLTNMSHEIRTPLNGVIGLAELLDTTVESVENRNKITLIKKSSFSLLHLINEILDLSKFQNSEIVFEKATFNLEELIKECVLALQPIASQKGLDLKVSIDPNCNSWILGDSTRIRQILNNLVVNSLKFTERGSVEVRLWDDNQEESEQILTKISVRDTGIGIPKESQSKIFGQFIQADSSTTRRFGGTGLGLAICNEIVVALGGTIDIESEVDKGTLFTVSLPLEKTSEVVQMSGLAEGVAKMTTSGLRILVAEDNEINQVVIQGLLEKIGYKSDIVNNGKEALEQLDIRSYDIVLMDCQMPIMDGFEATEKIIEKFGESRPYIIAVTASSLKEEVEKCFLSGMDKVLPKPIDIINLKSHLDTFIVSQMGRKDRAA